MIVSPRDDPNASRSLDDPPTQMMAMSAVTLVSLSVTAVTSPS